MPIPFVLAGTLFVTGTFFATPTPVALADAVVAATLDDYSPQEIRRRAEEFSIPLFKSRMLSEAQELLRGRQT